MKKLEKSKDEGEQHRQIASTPSNEELFAFLSSLFVLAPNDAPPGEVKSGLDACPERVSLRVVFNVGGREEVGPVLHSEEFKPMVQPIPKVEQIVSMSNRFDAAAQRDANAAGRKLVFTVQAFSAAKGSEPYARCLITKSPMGRELAHVDDHVPDRARDLEEREQTLRDSRFREMLMAQMVGDYRTAMADLVRMYETRLHNSEVATGELMKAHAQIVSLKEDLLDRSADRALRVRKEMNRQAHMEQVVGLLKNFALPAALAHLLGPATAMQIVAAANSGTGQITPPQQSPANVIGDAAASSPLVAQLQGFLRSLDDNQRHVLLGDWEGTTRKVAGELTEEQCVLLDGVASGTIPVTKLRHFVASITAEQGNAAKRVLSPIQLQTLMTLAVAASHLPEEQPPTTEILQ